MIAFLCQQFSIVHRKLLMGLILGSITEFFNIIIRPIGITSAEKTKNGSIQIMYDLVQQSQEIKTPGVISSRC